MNDRAMSEKQEKRRVPSIKGFKTPSEETYDRKRFLESLLALREKLADLERECNNDEVMRDTVTLACEGMYRQFLALERKCIREK